MKKPLEVSGFALAGRIYCRSIARATLKETICYVKKPMEARKMQRGARSTKIARRTLRDFASPHCHSAGKGWKLGRALLLLPGPTDIRVRP
jgi:hypothetical protein